MFVLYNKETGKITEVSWKQNPHADLEFQNEVEIDEEANVETHVTTPSGEMLLCTALMYRTPAFSFEEGELVHDTDWEAVP